ncbi:MAG: hypothetical protein ACYC26_04495 [Phycisphaerales bacterium]
MPRPGFRWRLVTISTKRSWLPGDPRGWRSRDHKRHSSGDYKHRPPSGEHEGLYDYWKSRCGEGITLPAHPRSIVGQAIIQHLTEEDYPLLAVSVDDRHAHFVVQLPDDPPTMRTIVGHAKRKSSRAIKAEMPGEVWASGGDFDPVDDPEHLRNAVHYVLYKQGPGAWAWSYKLGVVHEPTK